MRALRSAALASAALASAALALAGAAPLAGPAAAQTAPAMTAQSPSDTDAVRDVILGLFRAVDARDWDAVGALFADSVHVDYSDLGAEAQTQTPDEIVEGWAAVLPGFDRTVHQPHNLAVWAVGDRATATYDAIATHVLDGRDWTVFAGYDSEFVREDGEWKIARTRLSLYDQAGDTALGQTAQERVESGETTDGGNWTSPHAETVDRMFAALEEGDVEGWIGAFAPDGVQRMPLAPGGFPALVEGHAGLRAQYAPVAEFERQRYPREILATSDPRVVLAKYEGQIEVAPGQRYDNHYVGVFTFDDGGRVREFTEYFNPDVLLAGFPGLDPAHFSVHEAGASPESGVALREVSFDSHGDRLVGHLFLPPGYEEGQTYPGVVVTGSWTSVKEQMPDEYASLLARDGFVTLTFDFRGFGESEGEPRQYESPERKIEDIQAAVGFLAARPEVDGARIAGLGVCASAGYMAHAAGRDGRIARLALIAPWLHTPQMTEDLYAGRPGGRDRLLALGREARERYDATGEVVYDQAVSELNEMAAMYVPNGAFDYYLNPAKAAGAHYANRWPVMAWGPWLTFDGVSAADSVRVPVHVVHSEQGAVPDGARAFIGRLAQAPTVVWLDEYTQQDLYHVPEAIRPAIGATSAWLQRQLADG